MSLFFFFPGGKGGKKKKTKAGSKPSKANGSNWANVPLPPPPIHPLPGTEMDHYPNELHEGGGYVYSRFKPWLIHYWDINRWI